MRSIRIIIFIATIIIFQLEALAQYGPSFPEYRKPEQYAVYGHYKKVIDNFVSDKKHSIVITRLDSLALVSAGEGKYKQALFLQNESTQFYTMLGQNEKGLDLLTTTMNAFKQLHGTFHIEYAFALQLKALLSRRVNPNDTSTLKKLYLERISILDSLQIEGKPLTHALVDYGFFLKGIDFDKSLDILLKARKSALKNNSPNNMAGADYAIISSIPQIDFQETVIEVLKSDLDILSESKQSGAILYYTAFFNYFLGDRYYNSNKKDYDKIIKYSKKAARGLDTLNYPTWDLKASTYSILAYAYSEQNQPDEFWNYYNKSRKIIKEQQLSTINRASILSNLADAVLRFSTDSAKALNELIKKEEAYNLYASHFKEIEARYLQETGKHEELINLFCNFFPETKTIGKYKLPVVSDSLSYNDQLSYFAKMQNSFQELNKQKPGKKYNQHIKYLIDQQQKVFQLSMKQDIVSNEPTLLSENYNSFVFHTLPFMIDQPEHFSPRKVFGVFVTSKAMQLNSNIAKNMAQGDIELEPKFMSLLEKTKEIQEIKAKLNHLNITDSVKRILNIQLSSKLLEVLILRYKLDKNKKQVEIPQNKVPSLKNVQATLSAREGILDYCVNDTILTCCLTTPDTCIYFVHHDKNFHRIMRHELKAIKTGQNPGDLSDILFKPLQNELEGLSELIIIPNNVLSQIPFEWLKHPTTNKHMIEHFTITYNYSIALWYNFKQRENSKLKDDLLLVAPLFEKNNDADRIASIYRGSVELNPLPYTRKEISTIQDISEKNNRNTDVLLGNVATETEVKKQLPKYSIVHMATHGISNQKNPERSGIYLYQDNLPGEDNFLSLGELYNLNLQNDLVVLSACKTGIGELVEGEGPITLPRGFLYAGVSNIIASLWKVQDERTKELMHAFYTNLLTKNMKPSEALRAAKLQCMEKGFLPLDWAGFILTGID